jgi:hypothetical protein
MAASVSGSKTVNNSVSPQLTGTALTTLLAIAIENLTVAQFKQIADALARVPGGGEPAKTIGTLLV